MHQESGTDNLQQSTSNNVPLLPKLVLWFQPLQRNLIIMPLIMVILRFNHHNIHINLPLTLFQIQTPLQSNKLMTMKRTNFWNYSTKSMIMIFWVLNSVQFKLDYWLLLPYKFIQYLLFCFINMEETMLESQIACHTFLCLSEPRPMLNWLTKTRDIIKELGSF